MSFNFNDRSGVVSRYLSEIDEYPLLTEEEEQELAASLAGEDNSRTVNKLVESNLSFVVKVASEFRDLGLPFEDLLNEGNIGLIEAARRFDHRRGARFITYAVWWIRRSIFRALSRNSHLVRIPTYQMNKARQVRATERALAKELGREPDREEISRKLQSTIARIDELLQVRQKPLSLDDKVGRDKDTPLSDYLVDEWAGNPEENLIREESQTRLRLALQHLNDQERAVIINRFGLDGERTLTLREIGNRLGITGERVRQIECQATKHLRQLISRKRTTASAPNGLPGSPLCPT